MLQTAPPDLSYVCPDVRFREIGCIPIIGMKCAAKLMETPWMSRDVSALDELAALLTPQRIAARHGTRLVTLEHKERWRNLRAQQRLGDYLAGLDTTEFYLRQSDASFVDIAHRLPVSPRSRKPAYFDNIWIGPPGTVQTFHQDNHNDYVTNHNYFIQLFGWKYIAVCHPRDTFALTDGATVRGHHCDASPTDPNVWQRVPSLRHAIVGPCDLLHIPPSYWHYVQSLSVSISVSRWWFDNHLAEIIYSVGQGRWERPAIVVADTRTFLADLEEFGGASALKRVLLQLSPIARFAIIMAFSEFYGKGVFDYV
ncbi:cupin-like domain-containing protein [Mesorhizobium temperatum]|uniref:JmjC domain-containing protein n=1 Tax=Mesorhizobium temperatum TaxID=241416 RepID=A0A271LUY7_9HYPH|nr:cupin-like domain-containing protein [Mesorhizobium temperatum]PAQ11306.1 hypothetical protein CIT26_04640 [Mesorhizobium temperatum]